MEDDVRTLRCDNPSYGGCVADVSRDGRHSIGDARDFKEAGGGRRRKGETRDGRAETLMLQLLTDPNDRVRAVASERKTAEEELGALMRQWEELSTALAAHE